MEDKQEQKFHQMTEEPVGRLICHLALPCIISMLVTAFYNMADTFFVGMLDSDSATGAVGVVFSLMAIIQAVGFFFGHGSGNFISRELGKHHYEEASNMAATGFFSALATGLVICVLGQIFLEPLAYLLGSTDTILPYAKAYLRFILLGAPWMTASLVLNNQLRFQGSAAYAMVGITSGAVLNIALDPLLIFVFGMGVAGAALATIISQFISFCLLLVGCSRGGNLRIRASRVQLKWSYYSQVIRGGLPSLARQGLASIATICLNLAAKPYGDAAIAAMGVVQRIMMFGASAMIGFGQGFQPVCGFNYGARLYHRVKEGFWFCVKTSTAFLFAVGTLGFIFAPHLVALFRDSPEVIACGTAALRFQCVTFCFQGWVVMSNMMLQTIGRTVPATFLAMARQGIFFIPLVWILSALLGLTGIQMTQMVSDLLTLACAIPIQLKALKAMSQPA
ncbi:MATE family efflux transporter [Dysosmobacter sp.]|uniref:MATE family efflux transporter n=1 Tax=Dysosmobacter sp. TaxID=2591382 RepID=UPI002A8E2E04|nr:MATE family efflux transporter [Dysosmobacter sp.]MDY3984987.1 MATE family efflux transporter [Dysosmobacter sp.]